MPALARVAPLVEPSKATAAFAADVLAGLQAERKTLPAKYFYDSAGSRLFERISQLPEYYPTRTELGILREHAADMAGRLPDQAALVEFGSGASTKASILLGAAPQLAAYIPVDISSEVLHHEADVLRRSFPKLAVIPVDADFCQPFEVPAELASLPRAGFFPGSTIGNFEPHEACTFLRNAGRILGRGAAFIIGVDLVKDRAVLHAAYNDAAGVTAKFNLNLLARINRELGANFNLKCFEHHAFFNRERSRIEMHLASIKRQKVKVLGETIEFRAGETIHTENSYKYTPASFSALARGSGWSVQALWTDANQYFAVYFLVNEPMSRVQRDT
ncbi:MAG: L-histidine N(alpha)-methyltransferase [Xanthobacteraceae bacterium]